MNNCLDERLGSLLHAYELGLLDQADVEEFETHLLECDFCYHAFERNQEVIQLMMSSSKVRDAVNQAAGDTQIPRPAAATEETSRWWSRSQLSLYAAAAVILLLLYPAYLGLTGMKDGAIGQIQVVTLMPTRSQTVPTASRSAGDLVTLTFMFRGATPDQRYQVEIKDENGNSVFSDTNFGPFSEFGTAHLLLKLGSLANGSYRLTVAGPGQPVQEYIFLVTP